MQAGGNPSDRGRYVELISRGLTGSEVLLFGIAWLEPGETHILHHHPEAEELYYVIEGTGTFTVGDEEIRGEPGTAIFLPKNTPHRIFNDSSTKLTFGWCFSRPELEEVGIVWDE